MREFTDDLFISLDGFAAGVNQPAFFGYFGPELEKWVRYHINQPQDMIMGELPILHTEAPYTVSAFV